MKIRNYKLRKYYGCPIYVRQFLGTISWEYIVVINNEVYSASIDLKKKFLQRLFKLGYSRKEEEGAINYLTSMAMATIESILKVEPKELKVEENVPTVVKTPPTTVINN